MFCSAPNRIHKSSHTELKLWPIILLAATVLWVIGVCYTRTSAGVTGSDPYAYVQMAMDLVRHGTFLHQFKLAPVAYDLGVAVWPTVHVGYHLPPPDQEMAASVWPPGASVLLAAGYLLAGEKGLMWTVPLIDLLALLVTGRMIYDLFVQRSPTERLWLSALTVFLLATSYHQIELTLVPMADVPAQFFSTLSVWASWRAARDDSWQWGVIAGFSLGATYFIRYTQVLMLIPCLGIAYWHSRSGRRNPWKWLAPAGIVAGLVALPSFWYHYSIFGSPLTPVSHRELEYFDWGNIFLTSKHIFGELFRTNEFLYVLPFLIYGTWILWQTARPVVWLWATWIGVLMVFHLPYAPLRLRDLLSIMPVLSGMTAVGIVGWTKLCALCKKRKKVVYVLLLLLPTFLLFMRSRVTFTLLTGCEFNTFGYLSATERNSFERLSQVVPPEGVIGCSLNSGAIDLYAHRLTFRPGYWTEPEFNAFWQAMTALRRPVYLLIDGEEMYAPLMWAQQRTSTTLIWRAEMPFFLRDGRSSSSLVTLWHLSPLEP